MQAATGKAPRCASRNGNPALVSVGELAALIGVTENRIHQLRRAGVISRHSPGKYRADICAEQFSAYRAALVSATHRCLGCGGEISKTTWTGPKPKFCGERCRYLYRRPPPKPRQVKPTPAPEQRPCRRCGEQFTKPAGPARWPRMCEPCSPFVRGRRHHCCDCGHLLDKKPGEVTRRCLPCSEVFAAAAIARKKASDARNRRRSQEKRALAAGRIYRPRSDDTRTPEQKRADALARRRFSENEARRLKAIAEGRPTRDDITRGKAERQARLAAERHARAEAAAAARAKKPWLAPDLTPGQRTKIRRQHDRDFDLAWRLRDQLKRATPQFKARRMGGRLRDALVARRPSKALHKRLGYTVAQLAAHIERLFTPGMSWAAFRAGEIHLDHRLPLKLFDTTTDEGIRAAWALDNLQPLWRADNEAKQGRVLHPIPPDLAPVLDARAVARLAASPLLLGDLEPAWLPSSTTAETAGRRTLSSAARPPR